MYLASHPNIDAGYARTRGNGAPHISSLRDLRVFIRDLIDGVAHMHGSGVVHRDICMANVVYHDICTANVVYHDICTANVVYHDICTANATAHGGARWRTAAALGNMCHMTLAENVVVVVVPSSQETRAQEVPTSYLVPEVRNGSYDNFCSRAPFSADMWCVGRTICEVIFDEGRSKVLGRHIDIRDAVSQCLKIKVANNFRSEMMPPARHVVTTGAATGTSAATSTATSAATWAATGAATWAATATSTATSTATATGAGVFGTVTTAVVVQVDTNTSDKMCDDIADLVYRLLYLDPGLRPQAESLKSHPALRGLSPAVGRWGDGDAELIYNFSAASQIAMENILAQV